MNDELCTRDDLRVEVIANATVDDNGQPIPGEEVLLTAGIIEVEQPYFCVGSCERDFATWEEALGHIKGQGDKYESN